jgi:putative SOS response-associated peptidase YedK
MCGRYSFVVEDQMIWERFGVSVRSAIYKAKYNCAPTQDLAVITNEEPEVLNFFRWGLIPFWAKDPAIGNKLINAKAETLLEKPSFKNAFLKRRCLVPADSFYEWKKNGVKVPHRILRKDGQPFAMAGLWEKWASPGGESVRSFTIITIGPNAAIEKIHDRMPVILPESDERQWLESNDPMELHSLLQPCPPELLRAYPVSALVNAPQNDVPEIVIPAGPDLF